jgi:C-terminal processing protease CtpA/Prc
VGEDVFDHQFRLELLPDDVAVLTARTFSWPEPKAFFDFTRRAFEQMQAAGIRTLLIDVRDNGGGDDSMWLEGILPHIANRPYRWASRYTKKVVRPDSAKGERLGDVQSGTVDSWTPPQPDNPLRFHGRTYVLVGPATYSSAVLFANTMQDFEFAIIAGEGASVRSTQSGGVQAIKLPNTGLTLWSPRFLLTRPSGRNEPKWLTPDIHIEDDPLRSQTMVDAVLKADAARQQAKPLAH